MRHAAWIVAAVCLSSPCYAQSLGEIAKKEKQRRETNKEEAEVIDEEALRGSGGSYDPFVRARSMADSDPVESAEEGASETKVPRVKPPLEGGATAPPKNEHELRRERALDELKGIMSAMRSPARELIRSAETYQRACVGGSEGGSCDDQLRKVVRNAIIVGNLLNDARSVARRAGVSPGELRALREEYGMQHHIWDTAERLSAKFGALR